MTPCSLFQSSSRIWVSIRPTPDLFCLPFSFLSDLSTPVGVGSMAAEKKIVLKVALKDDFQCGKAMRALADLCGTKSIALDTSGGKITVVGVVDPVEVLTKLRRLFAHAHIVSVGPAKEPNKEDDGAPPLERQKKEDDGGQDDQSHATKIPPYELTFGFLNRITNNFSEERIIGRGGRGVVYKGVQDNGECIAVKKLHLMLGLDEEEFKNEFNNLMRVRHQNTIRLVGYCHHTAQVLVEDNGKHVSARVEERAFCSEYLEGGSLDKHLSSEPCALVWHTCYKIIRGVCEGLHYLHKGFEYPIYHLELKPTKILLDKDMMPKIRGFGFSRLSDSIETSNATEVTETRVYMPPEYISKRQITSKFDVFSLGIIILQIMAGNESYTKCADTSPKEFIEHVYEFWVNRMQGTISKHTSREVRTCIEIALNCVEFNREERPTINEIIQRLNKIDIVECSSIGELYRTREFEFEFLERITNGFAEQNIIGRGRYGVIYKGVLDNGEEIAVKKLHQTLWIDDEQFKNEINNLMRVQHKNIVQLVGYCHHTSQIFVEYKGEHFSASVVERAICLEYMQGESLDDQLSAESCRLDWDKCYKIIKGICEGLHYLHSAVTPIYHLDLKPAHILLDKDMVAKIGDFGLSVQTYMTASRELKGTFGYMPPEYINEQKISSKFDVFSLGVIIIQIMAGKEGYSKCVHIPPEEFIELVYEIWVNRMHATISKRTSHEVRTCIETALQCVEFNLVKRPTINEIIQRLNKIDIVECSSIGELYRTREFEFELLERITNGFSEQNIVGHGGYGVIYKGVLDNEEIAVKRLHSNSMPWIDDEQFKNELNNLMRVQHKNIVRLVGYCYHTSQIIGVYKGELVSATVVKRAICLEYMQGGSLDNQLSAESCKLDWDKCYKIIKGICEGLHYLHNSVTPIYHLDLKPANILLDKDMVAKIGDFGLSRLFDSAQTYVTASQDLKGTLGYMPPEYINGQKISPKFDVFSLGVIIMQILAGKEDYLNYWHTPRKEFIEHVHEKWRLRLQATMSSHVSEEMRTCIEIALKCVEDDRNRRPNITQIVNELSNIGIAKSSPVGQVQATMSPYVSEEVRTCIETVLKCVEDDRTRRPTIAEIVNELSKIGIVKNSPISQISQATFSGPQQKPETEQGGGHRANKLTVLHPLCNTVGRKVEIMPSPSGQKLNVQKRNLKLKLKRTVKLKLKKNVK